MNDVKNPEIHLNEEPRNDFLDVGVGFGLMFGLCFLIALVATVITVLD